MQPTKLLLSPRYRQAVELLVILFRNHERKFGNIPFVAHQFGVAHIVEQLTDDEDTIIAALHHDTLEDIDPSVYDANKLRADFGPRVFEIIQAVTVDLKRHDHDEARKLYLEHVKVGPVEACLISGADLLYNGQDMLTWVKREPEQGHLVFMANGGFERRQWFWTGRFEILKQRLGTDHILVKNIADILMQLEILPAA